MTKSSTRTKKRTDQVNDEGRIENTVDTDSASQGAVQDLQQQGSQEKPKKGGKKISKQDASGLENPVPSAVQLSVVQDQPSVNVPDQSEKQHAAPYKREEVKQSSAAQVSVGDRSQQPSVSQEHKGTSEVSAVPAEQRTAEQRPQGENFQRQQRHHHQQGQHQQQQGHNKKFIKKPHHHNNQNRQQNPHPQSSHYQQNQNDPNRHMDGGYGKQKEDIPPKLMTKELLEEMNLQDLYVYAKRYGVIGSVLMSHKTLVEKILEMQQDPDREILVEGVLEKLPDGFGFLRSARFDYVSSPDDVYVSPAQIRKMGLRTGDTISGSIRRPKENEKYFALARIDKVNFSDPDKLHERPYFERLSPVHPNKRFTLEYLPHHVSTRIMDIFTPVGKGQRGLVVAQPKAGKTVLSKEIAQSLIANHPETFLIMLLIDERPEEVADMKRFVKGAHAEVISSTFDEPAERHVQVAEIVLEKAKRLVEVGKDVVIFLDSVTRLARAYNTVAPVSGKILTGGVDANSLQRPKRFFGAARCLEEGGSLTILGSALIETGSRMDEVIYEEFKGTGNMEIHLSRKLSNRRIYPAFDLLVSGTRRDDLLQSEEELNRSWVLQKFLANMNTAEAMEFLLDKMKKYKTNEEFFESMNPKKAAATNGSNGSNGGK